MFCPITKVKENENILIFWTVQDRREGRMDEKKQNEEERNHLFGSNEEWGEGWGVKGCRGWRGEGVKGCVGDECLSLGMYNVYT
jgi:hypothetical protein